MTGCGYVGSQTDTPEKSGQILREGDNRVIHLVASMDTDLKNLGSEVL